MSNATARSPQNRGWFSRSSFLVTIIVIQTGFLLWTYYKDIGLNSFLPATESPIGFLEIQTQDAKKYANLSTTVDKVIEGMLIDIATHVLRAERHAKSMKTLRELQTVNDLVVQLFDSLNMTYSSVKIRNVLPQPKNVCPEQYGGSKFGFPLFETGFFTSNCSYSKPLSSLVTIINVFPDVSVSGKFLTAANDHLPGVHVLIGTSSVPKANTAKNVKFLKVSFDKEKMGSIWNSLVKEVGTPYVLIARDVHDIDSHANIERLLREIEIVGLPVAGGASRDMNSRQWTMGCFQRAFRNYTLIYNEGYDESVHGCLVCDHMDGPFLVQSAIVKKLKFDDNMQVGVFEDFFMRLGYEKTLMCPDVMFHTRASPRPTDRKKWENFISKHTIHRMKFNPGFEMTVSCEHFKCTKQNTLVIPPCCMEELNNMTNIVMVFCDKYDVICELNGGTLLAAVKMNMLFPWDVDSDIMFLLKNFTALKNNIKELKTARFDPRLNIAPSYKNGSLALGAYNYHSRNWFVEIYGKVDLTSTKFTLTGRNQTKVLLYGTWVGAPANPGLWVRNRYGNDLYKHAEHWRHLGRKTQFSHKSEDTRRFRPCRTAGDPKCLDLFRTDGNLLFSDPIP